MNYRAVLLLGAGIGAGALAGSTACTAADPGAISFSERPSTGASGTPGTSGGTPGTSGGSSGTSPDGGGGSSGMPSGPEAPFGTEAFVYQDPGVAANAANAAHANTVEGKDCGQAGCHLGGNKPWVFGGTVYTAPQNGQVVPRAEVKMLGPDNAEIGRAYTDANGNFWLDKPGTTIPAGAKVAVRKEGGNWKVMLTALQPADSGCTAERANCHGTAAQGKVWAQ